MGHSLPMRLLGIALALLGSLAEPVTAQPSWYRSPEQDYPRDRYLIGLGETTRTTEPALSMRMQMAADNARADLVRTIRTHIKAEFSSEMVENGGHIDAYARSRVMSSVSLEVDGIRIAEREDSRGTSYALAVLSRSEGVALHSLKLAGVELEVEEGWQQARSIEETGRAEAALRAYLRLYPLLALRDETRAVLWSLGSDSERALVGPSDVGAEPSVGKVTFAIDRVSAGHFVTLDDAVVALAFRLSTQLLVGRPVLVRPFNYGETQFSSQLSRYVARVLADKLVDAGLRPVGTVSGYMPRSTDADNELGQQTGAEIVVRGTYLPVGKTLRVFAHAEDILSGRKVGAAEVELDTALIGEGLSFRPQNYQQALMDAGVFADGELVLGNLRVETWTDRGAENVVLEDGESVTIGVRVNQPCFLQVTYHLANGKRVLLYENYYIDATKVNHAVILPDTFIVDQPLGAEVLHVFASTQQLPVVRTTDWDGYRAIADDLGGYVAATRGLRPKKDSQEMAETRLTITTIPKPQLLSE
jgi:hypothetical protein